MVEVSYSEIVALKGQPGLTYTCYSTTDFYYIILFKEAGQPLFYHILHKNSAVGQVFVP